MKTVSELEQQVKRNGSESLSYDEVITMLKNGAYLPIFNMVRHDAYPEIFSTGSPDLLKNLHQMIRELAMENDGSKIRHSIQSNGYSVTYWAELVAKLKMRDASKLSLLKEVVRIFEEETFKATS